MQTWVKCTVKDGRAIYVNPNAIATITRLASDSYTHIEFPGSEHPAAVQEKPEDIIKATGWDLVSA